MGWMELLSNLTGSLSWPALIVILALIFRPEIATKIGELEGIKSRFGSFDFRRRVESARQTLDASSEIKRIGTVLRLARQLKLWSLSSASTNPPQLNSRRMLALSISRARICGGRSQSWQRTIPLLQSEKLQSNLIDQFHD